MPCIQTKVNVTLTPEKEEAIKQKFGQAITAIPGKTENWLMCTFEDGCRMYFRGEAARRWPSWRSRCTARRPRPPLTG